MSTPNFIKTISSQPEFDAEILNGTTFVRTNFTFNLAIGHQEGGYPSNLDYSFEECSFISILIQQRPHGRIHFKNCDSQRGLVISDNQKIENLIVENSSALKLIRFKHSNAGCRHLMVKESDLEIRFDHSGCTNLSIEKSKIKLTLNSIPQEFESIRIYKESEIEMKLMECASLVKSEIQVLDSKLLKLTLQDSNLKKLILKKSSITDIQITNLLEKQQDTLLISGIENIEYGTFEMEKNSINTISLDSGSINSLDLSKISKSIQPKYTFKNINFNILNLAGLSNSNKFDLYGGSINNFILKQTILGQGSRFSNLSIKNIVLLQSEIGDCKFINIKWPEGFLIEESGVELDDIRNSYNQLNQAVSRSISPLEEVNFRINERRILLKQSVLKFKKNRITTKAFWDGFGNYLILKTDKSISNFGQNIWRTIMIWGILHSLLLTLLYWEKSIDLPFSIKHINPELTLKGIAIFLYLLNPVHSNSIYGFELTGVSDFFLRLSSSYLLYYFLRTTRKFHFK
jgi:hypothetical protein